MAEITCQFVRPDKLMFEGSVDSVILQAIDGELGILPGHSSEICALGQGVIRLNRSDAHGGIRRILVSGGYAEVDKDLVIVLAEHARALDDIDPKQVKATKQEAQDALDSFGEEDSRRAYYQNKIDWCNLMLEHVHEQAETEV